MTWNLKENLDFTNCYICPDEWSYGANLLKADDFKDSGFPGCAYRLPSNGGELAVNVTVSGRKSHLLIPSPIYKTRVKIEFVGDGEPSTFVNGWLYSDYKLFESAEDILARL